MRTALVIAVIALVGLAACGDEDETTTTPSATSSVATTTPTGPTGPQGSTEPADEDQSSGVAVTTPGKDPNGALEAFFTSGDPDLVCRELATEKLIASAYGDEQGCRQAQAPGATPDAIEVREIKVGTHRVNAVVIPEGGPNDGFEHEVVLVEDGGGWRVDSLEADIPAGP